MVEESLVDTEYDSKKIHHNVRGIVHHLHKNKIIERTENSTYVRL